MKKLTTIITLSAMSILSAHAEFNPEEFQTLELGKEYTLEAMKSFKGKFTPSIDGQIQEYGAVPVYLANGDELELITAEKGYTYAGFINGRQSYQFAVTAGTTYYFYSDFIMNNGVFSIEMNTNVKLIESDPEVGQVYDPARYANIGLVFNQALKVGKTEIIIGDLRAEVEIHTVGSDITVLPNDILRQWYNEEKIEGGKELQILLSDIKDGSDNKLDDITVTFKTAHKPVELVEAQLPAEILSFYTDESAKAVFTFSGAMAKNPTVELCYAPVELGYEYTESLEAEVEGNVITVDFGGKLRTAEMMSTSGRTDRQIYLRLIGLTDAEGQMVWSTGQGTVGSFLYVIPFAEINRLNITSEFTPSMGSSLEKATSVNIYFNCADHLTYTGVVFSSGEEKVIVPMSEITVDNISESEVELTVPIPAGWNTKSNVMVSLDGLATDDGYDHSTEISAKFNGFTLLYCSIQNGAKLKSIVEGTIIKVETNLKESDKLEFEIEGIFGPKEMTASGDGVYLYTMPETIVFDIDVDYTLNFIATPGGVESILIKGDTAPFEYSDIELVSIAPEEGSTVNTDTEIKLTFSGIVALTVMPESATFAAESFGGDEPGYGYEWTVKFEKVEGDEIVLAFSADDLDGQVIEGNEGTGAESYFKFTFKAGESSITEIEGGRNEATYDMQGRLVISPKNGIFIRDGKKIRL